MMLRQTMALLREHGVRPSRRAGQNQVVDPLVLERMVEYAELSRGDVVLEIGAGVGNLTSLLAQRAGKVIAVERDSRLVDALRERFGNDKKVEILFGDALSVGFPKFDKVVANLPYGISSDITFRLLEHKFKLAVLMFQKEFADRLVAEPGSSDYSRLTVNARYRASIELLDEVPPEAFFPQPKVTSAIAKLRPREPLFSVADEKLFLSVVRALFQHRRQRVRNALYHSFEEVLPKKSMSKTQRRAFIGEKIPTELAEVRVMDLSPEKFGVIADLLISP